MPRKPVTTISVLDELLPAPKLTATAGTKQKFRRDDLELWEGNPRRDRTVDSLFEMGESLSVQGQLQQLIVRWHPDPAKAADGVAQVIAGGTRFLAGAPPYGDFPIYDCEIRALTDLEAYDLSYAENAKRTDMRPLDHAMYFARRMKMDGGTDDSLRKLAKKQNVGHERVRQFLNLLALPGFDAETGAIAPSSILGEFERLELNEKHGRALLLLQDQPDLQLSLLRQIERSINPEKPNARLSGNQAIGRAETMLTNHLKESAPAPTSDTPAAEPEPDQITLPLGDTPTGKGNADDGDFAANDAQLASRDHETRAQNAGTGGVGSTAPASSGVGMATSDTQGQNTKGAVFKADTVEDALRPTVEKLRTTTRILNEETPLTPDQEIRAEKLLKSLNMAVSELTNVIDFSKKLRANDEEAAARRLEAAKAPTEPAPPTPTKKPRKTNASP